MRGDMPTLWLEHEDNVACPTSVETFVGTIKRSRPPLLALLISCDSAGNGYDDTINALGPKLAKAGVPAIIGFRGEVKKQTVKTLLRAFFSDLERHGLVDRALTHARITLGEDRPWWQAVLWLRTDGRLWNASDENTLRTDDRIAWIGGLDDLLVQLHQPEVLRELSTWRLLLKTSRDSIDLFVKYKEIHDQLQYLEKSFNVIDKSRQRIARDPAAWEELFDPVSEARQVIAELLSLMTHQIDQKVDWSRSVEILTECHKDLPESLGKKDIIRLREIVSRLSRISRSSP